MRRLSASSTYWYKRVFPVFWFGFLAVFLAAAAWSAGHASRPLDWQDAMPFLLAPTIMVVVGFLVFRRLIFDLVDEVWLDGEQLVVKNRGERIRIALTEVMNVNATVLTNPRRVTLMLRTDSRFGRQVTFVPASPRGLFSAWRMDPIANELIERVDALRRNPR
jgi:hypothetical protein